MELQVEARNMEVRDAWQKKLEEERDRLVRHHPGLVHRLRVTFESNSHHKEGGYEIRLIASIPNDTVVVKRKGEDVMPALVEAFDILGLQLKEMQRKKRKNVKAQDSPLT